MKKTFLLIVITIIGVSLYGQRRYTDFTKHELSVSLGGGFSSFRYSLAQGGSSSAGLGLLSGLGYRYNITQSWNINTGIEYNRYQTEASSLAFENITYGLTDVDGNSYDLYSQVNGFKEKQRATFLAIPLLVGYETGDNLKVYIKGGFKILLPLSAGYSSEQELTLYNRGYFPKYDNWAIDQKFMGFGRFDVEKTDGTIQLKTAFTASAEAGVKWDLTDQLFLYAGFTIDYGLTDMIDNHAQHPYIITNSNNVSNYNYTNSSILTATISPEGEAIAMTDKVIPMFVGLKVQLAWGF